MGLDTPPRKKRLFCEKCSVEGSWDKGEIFTRAREGCGIQKGGEKNGEGKEVGKHKSI